MISARMESYAELVKPLFAQYGFDNVNFGCERGSNNGTPFESIHTTIPRKGNAELINELKARGWTVRFNKPLNVGFFTDIEYRGYSMVAELRSPNLLNDSF